MNVWFYFILLSKVKSTNVCWHLADMPARSECWCLQEPVLYICRHCDKVVDVCLVTWHLRKAKILMFTALD